MTTAKKPAATKTKKPTTRAKTVKVAPIVELPKNPFAFEVFDLVSKQRTKAKKVEVLKKYEHISLKVCLIWNFDDTVQSVLPEGDVPFASYEEQTTQSGSFSKKLDLETRRMYEQGNFSLGVSDTQGRTTIRRESKNFYMFVKGGNDA